MGSGGRQRIVFPSVKHPWRWLAFQRVGHDSGIARFHVHQHPVRLQIAGDAVYTADKAPFIVNFFAAVISGNKDDVTIVHLGYFGIANVREALDCPGREIEDDAHGDRLLGIRLRVLCRRAPARQRHRSRRFSHLCGRETEERK